MAKKYRPYYTIPEMQEIARCLKLASTNTELIRYQDAQLYKASTGLTEPQYIPHPRPTLEDKLGISGNMLKIDIVQSKLDAYTKWCANPASCSVQEIARVHMYRYENDLMDAEEEAAYEKKMDIGY